MPEDGVLGGLENQAQKRITWYEKVEDHYPEGRVVLFSRSNAEGGTRKEGGSKGKVYETVKIMVDASEEGTWEGSAAQSEEPLREVMNVYDLNRCKGKIWADLARRQLKRGPMFVSARGKELAIACGYHCFIINFGTEGTLLPMSISNFKKLVADDCEGSNPNRAKAQRMRSFVVPSEMIEDGSKEVTVNLKTSRSGKVKGRRINVFAAFLAETDTDFATWEDMLGGVDGNIVRNVLSDNNKLHGKQTAEAEEVAAAEEEEEEEAEEQVQAQDETEEQVEVEVANGLTDVEDEGGTEDPRVKTKGSLDSRKSGAFALVLTDFYRLVTLRVVNKNTMFTATDLKPGSKTWDKIWDRETHGPDWRKEQPLAIASLREWRKLVSARSPRADVREFPIVVAMKNQLYFNGFGAHMANDFAHYFGVHPCTPHYVICDSDEEFERFEKSIISYLELFGSQAFLRRTAPAVNSDNPLRYNANAARHYITKYVYVYRKETVNVAYERWERMKQQGLFDANHTIGEAYDGMDCDDTRRAEYKKVQVHKFKWNSHTLYSTIVAACPTKWKVVLQYRGTVTDMRKDGYRTTIGTAEFHDSKLNMTDVKFKSKGGRPKKMKTGKPGRPCTSNSAAKAAARLKALRQSCTQKESSGATTSIETSAEESVATATNNSGRATRAAGRGRARESTGQ